MRDTDLPVLSDELFHKFAVLLYRECGIKLKDYKKYLVIGRLSKLIGPGREFPDFQSYYQALSHDRTGNLIIRFVNELATTYSFFFRDEVHFKFLKDYLVFHAGSENYIRIWSAACSTGEEPYSIAITVLQSLPVIKVADIKILATDVSTRVLDIAGRGVYPYSAVRDRIDERNLKIFFDYDRSINRFSVKQNVRDLISFRYLNLFSSYPFKRDFDIVFLRNVLIYFDSQEKQSIVNRISEYIKPGGSLVLGLSETLVDIGHDLIHLRNSIYQKKR